VHNHSEADDLLQTVFVRINSHLDNLKNADKIDSWIYRITRNTIADYYRKEKQKEKLALLPVPHAGEHESVNFTQEASRCVRETMRKLPEKYAEALELSEFQGLSQKEVSERLGISYSGAKSRIQRGRQQLKWLLLGCCHIESDRYGNIVDFRILKNQ
jgi:RNA polymerase sigma-70 factor (ECF subfamily)